MRPSNRAAVVRVIIAVALLITLVDLVLRYLRPYATAWP